jgi:hypothetical protein
MRTGGGANENPRRVHIPIIRIGSRRTDFYDDLRDRLGT